MPVFEWTAVAGTTVSDRDKGQGKRATPAPPAAALATAGYTLREFVRGL